MLEGALETATVIASKSPVAVQGTKLNLIFSRDHSVQEGLDHMVSLLSPARVQSLYRGAKLNLLL